MVYVLRESYFTCVWFIVCVGLVYVFDCVFFFFQAEDGIRDLVRSRGLGDVYKRQAERPAGLLPIPLQHRPNRRKSRRRPASAQGTATACLLYTSDAADDLLCVDLGGRRIIKKKKAINHNAHPIHHTKAQQHTHTSEIHAATISRIN